MSFCHPTNSVKAVKEAQISDLNWENQPLEKLYGVCSAVSRFYWNMFSAVHHVADLKVTLTSWNVACMCTGHAGNSGEPRSSFLGDINLTKF